MKCFVAGGTGVIGRRTVRLLVGEGHDVSVLSRSELNDRIIGELGARPARASLFDGDALIAVTAGHDAIVNLATNIPTYRQAVKRSAWIDNERIRTEGVDLLLAAARANDVERHIQESVTFTYVDAADRWIDEEQPRTTTRDGAAVAHAESAVAAHTAAGGIGVVLRFGLFYDVESDHTSTQAGLVRRRIDPFIGEADAHLALTGVPAAARAVVMALGAPAGVFNVVDDDPPSRRQVGEDLARRLGLRGLRRLPPAAIRKIAPDLDTQMRSQRVDNAAFRSIAGWMPDHRGADGLVATIAEVLR